MIAASVSEEELTLVNRRNLLGRTFTAALGSVLLAACSQTPSAPPTATSSSQPTSASGPTPVQPTAETASGSAAKVTVRFGPISSFNQSALKGLLSTYQANNSHVQIVTTELPPYDSFYEKMMTMLAAGTAPDAFMLLCYWAAVFGKKGGILLTLDDHLKTVPGFSLDNYEKSLLIDCQWNGKTHALPFDTNVQGIIYNRDQFDAAGVTTVPQKAREAWNWDQFLTVCQKLKQAKVADFPYGIYPGAPQGRLIFVYEQSHGIVTADLKHGDLNNPDSIKGIDLIVNLFKEKLAPSAVWTGTGAIANVQELFRNKKVAMMHGGQWHVPWARDNVKFNWGVTYLQKGTILTTIPGGEVYAAFSQTKVPADAAALIAFLAGEEGQKKLDAEQYRVPSLTSLAKPGVMQWGSYKEQMDLFVDALQYGSERILKEYYADGWAKIDSMLRARTADLATGTKTASQWAADVNTQIDGFIQAGD